VEQGHQVGIKDDRRYHELTTFEKRTESLLKARSIKCHPSPSKPKLSSCIFMKKKKP
jgi:hypothetical protein